MRCGVRERDLPETVQAAPGHNDYQVGGFCAPAAAPVYRQLPACARSLPAHIGFQSLGCCSSNLEPIGLVPSQSQSPTGMPACVISGSGGRTEPHVPWQLVHRTPPHAECRVGGELWTWVDGTVSVALR